MVMVAQSSRKLCILSSAQEQIEAFLNSSSSCSESAANGDPDEGDVEPASFTYGLLVGQPFHVPGSDQAQCRSSSTVGYLVYLARTPAEVSADEPACEGVSVTEVDKVDPEWVMEHAKQVTNMLPGGMTVLGMFVADRSDSSRVLKSPVLKKCMQVIHSAVKSAASLDPAYSLLHINLNEGSDKLEAVLLSGSDGQQQSQPLLCHQESRNFRFMQATAKFLLDYPIVFAKGDESEQPLSNKFMMTMQKIESNLDKCSILFNDEYRPDSDELLDRDQKQTEASDEDPDQEVKKFSVQILLDPEVNECGQDVEMSNVSARMRLSGRMAIQVFLHPQASVADAVFAVKQDLLRSLHTRCMMHCDSLVGEDYRGTEEPIPLLHEPPRRVSIRLPSSDVCISDFLFPGVSSDTSVDVVKEMFGFQPELDDIDDELELVASPKSVLAAEGEEDDERAPSSMGTSTEGASRGNSAFIVLSVLVVLVSAAVTYFYSLGHLVQQLEDQQEEQEAFVPSSTQESDDW